jgi:hypothetical protein
MADYDNYLIRKVLFNDREVDLSFLIEATVVETIDLSGPRIMMKFNDQYSLIRDELGIEPGSILEIVVPMGAGFSDEDDPLDAYEDYRVLSMPVTAKGEVILNCMHNDMWGWKQPIVRPRIFYHWNPVQIIKAWEPDHNRWDYVYDEGCGAGSFTIAEDYHFLPGERVSLTIRQMALEHAACFFLTRGERFHCQFKKRMVEAAPMFTYDHYDEDFPIDVEFDAYHGQILFYARSYNETILEDMMVRRPIGFNMLYGFIDADRNIRIPSRDNIIAPAVSASQKYEVTLNNLNVNLIPVVEFTAPGNAYLVAGCMMKLNWYESDKEHVIDESLPDKALVGTVVHHYNAQKYFVRVKCVNLAPWVEE